MDSHKAAEKDETLKVFLPPDREAPRHMIAKNAKVHASKTNLMQVDGGMADCHSSIKAVSAKCSVWSKSTARTWTGSKKKEP